MDNLHALPDDIVGLILLQLDSPICLLRAASTCKRWRGIITGTVFLRRFRSLHEPPVTGCYYYNSTHFVPLRFELSSSSAIIDSRYFLLDFLPEYSALRWTIEDSQGSLLLLDRSRFCGKEIPDIIICEPLTGSYEVIPPWTEALAGRISYTQFYLLDGNSGAETAAGGISTSNFRVLCVAQGDDGQIQAGVFTAGGSSWRQKSIDDDKEEMRFMGRAAGSLYWDCGGFTVTSLDQSTAAAEFSSYLLSNVDGFFQDLTVATGGDGEARIVGGGAGGILRVFARQQGAGGEWTLEKSVQMSAAMFGLKSQLQEWYFCRGCDLGVHGRGKVVIVVYRGRRYYAHEKWKFSLDIEKLEAERLPDAEAYPIKLPWPPSLHARMH